MKAVDFAMSVIFINCGFAIVDAIGVFGSDITGLAGIFQQLKWLTNPVVMGGLAALFAAGTIILPFSARPGTDKGLAYITFIGIFWGSIILTGVVIFSRIDMPGIELFYTIYCIAAALVFVNALIQMASGGQKTHV